jgi:hypothetical protein
MALITVLVAPAWSDAQWFKGATHVHSLWSDGDGAPEVIADWFKSHGWHFVCFSEHNILMEGEKYTAIKPDGFLTAERVLAIQQRFGNDWPVVREVSGQRQMKLKTLEELSAHFNEPGEFLLIPAEEMTTQGGNPHMNVINVRELVPGQPEAGDPVPKMQAYLNAVAIQEREHGVPMLVHLDHPNWRNALTTRQMMEVRGLRFFEVYNGAGPTDRGYPEKGVPTTERRWDVILSMKLRRHLNYKLYGVATDDSHRYFDFAPGIANPGRGWVMVRAESLDAGAIVEAMERGDFYGSSGVTLKDVEGTEQGLSISIDGEPGVTYTTRYIGTRKDFDKSTRPFLDADGNPVPNSSLIYSDTIGQVLMETTDLESRYEFTGDELYVRATITSDKPMANPPVEGDLEMAWVQPVMPR